MATRKRPPLSEKRAEYVDGRVSGRLVGQPLHYPAAPADDYDKAMRRIIREMERAYRDELLSVHEQVLEGEEVAAMDASLASQLRIRLNALRARFAKLFSDRAPAIVSSMLERVDQSQQRILGASLKELSGGLTLKTDVMPAALSEALTSATNENVSLIKSIQSRYHTQVEGIVMRSIQPGGRGAADIKDGLMRYKGVTERRAKIISTDQVRKVTAAMNYERSKSLGITKAKWVHSHGGKNPRPKHLAFNGKIFDLSDPPAIGDNGQKVLPGAEISCRCSWTPVIEW